MQAASKWTAVAIVRPIPRNATFTCKLRAQFPEQPDRGGGASHGARGVGVLPVAVRRGDGADARPRRRFPLRLALAARAARSMTLEQEQYSPDSLGDLYGRVTELLGLRANADEHKVQWLSVAGDDRFTQLFLEDPAASPTTAAHGPLVISARSG